MKTQRFAQLIAALAVSFAALLTAPEASASGPVNQLLTGGLIDPYATTLRVVPPQGGMVVLHRNGAAVAWFMQPGLVNLSPNQIYTLTATRGQTMLFNANLLMRRGYTQAVWGRSNQPQLSFQPTLAAYPMAGAPRVPASAGVSQPAPGAASADGRARLPRHRHSALLAELGALETDQARWRMMKRYDKSYALSAVQKRGIVGTFESASYRRSAQRTLGVSAAQPKAAPAPKAAVAQAAAAKPGAKATTSKPPVAKQTKRATSRKLVLTPKGS